MIQELDLVALLIDRPAPDGSAPAYRPIPLRRGDVGTVVHIYGSNDLVEVEFTNAKGETIAVETLHTTQIRAVDLGRVLLHYSDLETAA